MIISSQNVPQVTESKPSLLAHAWTQAKESLRKVSLVSKMDKPNSTNE